MWMEMSLVLLALLVMKDVDVRDVHNSTLETQQYQEATVFLQAVSQSPDVHVIQEVQ